MSVLKKILGVFKIILVILMIIFIVCFCSIVYQKKVMKVGMPNLFGYTGGAIVSGSMEPNIHVGDYVIVDVNGGYNKGDVVMFKRGNAYIAHRVMDVFDDYIITKGDNNETEDVEIPKDTVVGPVVKVIRGLGSFTMLLAKYKFLVLIIVVLVIILL